MSAAFDIIDVTAENVTKTGFFCYMSKMKTPGYQKKLKWVRDRFAEGLKIKIIHEHGGRDTAFIEYIPGEFAWRAVDAAGYLVIHCIWVVRRGKWKGYGARLLEECISDAHRMGKEGVVMVSSDGTWLASKEFFIRRGFKEVDHAPPSFQLLALPLNGAQLPKFPNNWEERCLSFGSGLTISRAPQCPYIESATQDYFKIAGEMRIPSRVVEFHSARELQDNAPSPYGVFGVVYNGKFLSYIYLHQDDFKNRLAQFGGQHGEVGSQERPQTHIPTDCEKD